MVEGFHRGFKTLVNRPRPTVREYFLAIQSKQIKTDFLVDRLLAGKTPKKNRKTTHARLHQIVNNYSTYTTKLEYLFAVAGHFEKNKKNKKNAD